MLFDPARRARKPGENVIVVDEDTVAAIEFLALRGRETWQKTVKRAIVAQKRHAEACDRARKKPGPNSGIKR